MALTLTKHISFFCANELIHNFNGLILQGLHLGENMHAGIFIFAPRFSSRTRNIFHFDVDPWQMIRVHQSTAFSLSLRPSENHTKMRLWRRWRKIATLLPSLWWRIIFNARKAAQESRRVFRPLHPKRCASSEVEECGFLLTCFFFFFAFLVLFCLVLYHLQRWAGWK